MNLSDRTMRALFYLACRAPECDYGALYSLSGVSVSRL